MAENKKTKEELIKIHQKLHESLDVLVADMIMNTEMLPSRTSVMELMEWSHKQTIDPVCYNKQ